MTVPCPQAAAAPEPDLTLDWAPDNHCETFYAPIRVVNGFLEWGAKQTCRGASVFSQYLRVELHRELYLSGAFYNVDVENSALEQRFSKTSVFDQTRRCKSEAVRTYHMLVWAFADDERQRTYGESETVDLPCEL
ncbi:hypothetical protein [Segniliparus rugosus]|uniref:hypothetical protein n=1 Tax=Segniliparus rugosus TaxID=286804 RepID=UPI0001F04217|nr:hypothetical protein [Segniliparus rugosus]